tara:strand:- start:139 stop:297 length:159 start_codon:yes stop_codon:yes gene_type:complete
MKLTSPNPDALLQRIHEQRRKEAFANLLRYRNTSQGIVTISTRNLHRMLSEE